MQNDDQENIPNIEKQGWQSKELVEEAANRQSDEITREILRGDETKGEPDERDIAGNVSTNETPQGREETKYKTGGPELNG
jgi:hypothetical protein